MHKPVLLNEVVRLATEVAPTVILDGTFGRGGHARAMLEAVPGARVIAYDRDQSAIEFGQSELRDLIEGGRLELRHKSFHDLGQVPPIDFMLLDLGVSSPQLDEPGRGFSFYHDGPLDMRMDQTQKTSAADLINDWSEVELNDLFYTYGEIRRPQRVVRAIAHDRKQAPFTTTRQLAGLIERVEGWRKKGHHPATNYFLSLRMAVNQELSGLEGCLPDLFAALSSTGRMVILTFHSLEDRIIKRAFRERTDLGYPLFKRVLIPTDEELAQNPRARSAKLRVFQRGIKDDKTPLSRSRSVSQRIDSGVDALHDGIPENGGPARRLRGSETE